MADTPHQWAAYARLQAKLSATSSITIGGALEEALNVIHQHGFQPEAVSEGEMVRFAANAARRHRYRQALRRQAQAQALDAAAAALQGADDDVSTGPSSLDDAVHARLQLRLLLEELPDRDWDLLAGVAAGVSYRDLAVEHSSTPAALRSRVCRLRSSGQARVEEQCAA